MDKMRKQRFKYLYFCKTSAMLIWVIFWYCDNVKQKEKIWDLKLIFCLAHDNLVNSVVAVCYGLTSIFLRANKQSLVVDCKNVVKCVIQFQKVTLVTKVKSHKSNLKSMDIYILHRLVFIVIQRLFKMKYYISIFSINIKFENPIDTELSSNYP